MSFRDKSISICDWAGNNLYIGPYDSPEVDKVLDANRCTDCEGGAIYYQPNPELDKDAFEAECPVCGGDGYSGDFEVNWVDDSDKGDCNVYEYINY